MSTKIQLRRDSAADWTSNDPTLAAGEMGVEEDTGLTKIGDGTTAWTSLAYHNPQRVWVGSDRFTTVAGSPTFATSNSIPSWRLDAASAESVVGFIDGGQVEQWSTLDLYVWLVTVDTTASNDVRWLGQLTTMADNDTAITHIYSAVTTEAITGGTADRAHRLLLSSGVTAPTAGNPAWLLAYRSAGEGTDNFAGDIGFLGYELVRAS